MTTEGEPSSKAMITAHDGHHRDPGPASTADGRDGAAAVRCAYSGATVPPSASHPSRRMRGVRAPRPISLSSLVVRVLCLVSRL